MEMQEQKGHLLVEIVPGGVAQRAGLLAGDRLMKIDGHFIQDVIDYQFYIPGETLKLELLRDGKPLSVTIHKNEGQPLGIRFEDMLMDRPRACRNHCMFCFVDQMPKGQRDSLYFKDDDWRLSLLSGNFVTLTNVSKSEMERIAQRRACPLYISVHATDGQVRARMMGNPDAADIMEKLQYLNDVCLYFHAQIVLCPGLNDGDVLRDTLRTLADMDYCLSIAVVPVGLTSHREGLCPLRPVDEKAAQEAIEICEYFYPSEKVFLADELYIKAGIPMPPYDFYGDFPQVENGVGMMRLFEGDYGYGRGEILDDPSVIHPRRVCVVSGVSVAPFMRELMQKRGLPGVEAQVLAVENQFFGPTVTVTGLLTGSDLVRACADVKADEILIPSNMLREGEEVFLDGMTLAQVREKLQSPLTVCGSDGESFAWALAGQGDD